MRTPGKRSQESQSSRSLATKILPARARRPPPPNFLQTTNGISLPPPPFTQQLPTLSIPREACFRTEWGGAQPNEFEMESNTLLPRRQLFGNMHVSLSVRERPDFTTEYYLPLYTLNNVLEPLRPLPFPLKARQNPSAETGTPFNPVEFFTRSSLCLSLSSAICHRP